MSSLKTVLVSFLLSLPNNSRIQLASYKYLFIQNSNRDYMLLMNSYIIRTWQGFFSVGLQCPIQYCPRRFPEDFVFFFFSVTQSHLQSWNFNFAYIFFKKQQQNIARLDLCLWYQNENNQLKLILNFYAIFQ